MKNPLVSIGIPTFDRPVLLEKCLVNIDSYTYRNLEVVISENSQHAPTDKVVAKYPHLNIRYYRQPKNIGIVENFKFVLTHALGDFFFFHADDDAYDKLFVQDAIDTFTSNSDVVTFFGRTDVFNSINSTKREHRLVFHQSRTNSLLSDAIALYNLNNLWNSVYPNKLNYLIYAIHRTHVIKKSFLGVIDILTNERDVVSGIALLGRIELSDNVYYRRLIHDESTGSSSNFTLVTAIKKAVLFRHQLSPMERLRLRRLNPLVALHIANHLSSLHNKSAIRMHIYTAIIYWRNISLIILELLIDLRKACKNRMSLLGLI